MPHLASSDSGLIRLRQTLRLTEQRSRPRYATCRGAMIRPHTASAAARQPAVVADVSESGLGLFVFSRFPEDALLLVEFEGALAQPRIARVAHVTESEEGVTLG